MSSQNDIDKVFRSSLDGHLKSRIRELLNNDPNYFTRRIHAREVLPYLEDVIKPQSVRERIGCRDREEGNVRAVRMMVDEMQRFNGFGLQFLQALVGTGHSDIATELFAGFNGVIPPGRASFFQKLIGIPPDEPPPPYRPRPPSESILDQERKLSHLQDSRSESRSVSTVSDNDSTLSDPLPNEMSFSMLTSSSMPPQYVSGSNRMPDPSFSQPLGFPNISVSDGGFGVSPAPGTMQVNPDPSRFILQTFDQSSAGGFAFGSANPGGERSPLQRSGIPATIEVNSNPERIVQPQADYSGITRTNNNSSAPPTRPESTDRLYGGPSGMPQEHEEPTRPYHDSYVSDLHSSEECISDDDENTSPKQLASTTLSECSSDRMHAILPNFNSSASSPQNSSNRPGPSVLVHGNSSNQTIVEREQRIIVSQEQNLKFQQDSAAEESVSTPFAKSSIDTVRENSIHDDKPDNSSRTYYAAAAVVVVIAIVTVFAFIKKK